MIDPQASQACPMPCPCPSSMRGVRGSRPSRIRCRITSRRRV